MPATTAGSSPKWNTEAAGSLCSGVADSFCNGISAQHSPHRNCQPWTCTALSLTQEWQTPFLLWNGSPAVSTQAQPPMGKVQGSPEVSTEALHHRCSTDVGAPMPSCSSRVAQLTLRAAAQKRLQWSAVSNVCFHPAHSHLLRLWPCLRFKARHLLLLEVPK